MTEPKEPRKLSLIGMTREFSGFYKFSKVTKLQ
jgi:hypothetical protein